MMKTFKLKFSDYIQNISMSKSFGEFVLSVKRRFLWTKISSTAKHTIFQASHAHEYLNLIRTMNYKLENLKIVSW